MKLAKLQKQFAKNLYWPNQDQVLRFIKTSGVITAEERLRVYRNNVFGGLDNALEVIYEATRALVGDKLFSDWAFNYHQKYYSQSGNLDDYGEFFAVFLAEIDDPQLMPIIELVKLEWFFHRCYFVKDVKLIDLVKLQNLQEEEYLALRFKLHPSCFLLVTNFSVYQLWLGRKAFKPDKKSGLGHEYILVERCGLARQVHKLSVLEYLFLNKVKNNNTLGKIYQDLAKENPEFDIGFLISKYVAIGVLSDFRIIKTKK